MIDYRKNNHYSVYVHINKINRKTYVGITGKIPVEKRWGNNGVNYNGQLFYNAIQKYGWDNFEHDIVAQNLTIEEAKLMEISLIDGLKSTIKDNGYNVSEGGCLQECFGKKILQFDLHGNFIEEYNTISNASLKTKIFESNITNCCIGKYLQAGGYIWRYKDEIKNIEDVKNDIDISLFDRYESVYQFTLNGDFVAEYKSASEATKNNNGCFVSSILDCCRGKYKYSNGFIWKFKKDVPNVNEFKYTYNFDISKKEPEREHILQFDFDGNLLNEFNSTKDACKYIGCDSHTITYVCSGRTKSGKGYLWMYKKDYNGIPPKYEIKKRSKSIKQYDLNNNYIATFESANEAEKNLGIKARDIRAVCNGKQKTAKGFIWKYVDN